MTEKKLVLVIGATGAQGLPVVVSLLAPNKDGSPSPYAVRALTRDPTSDRAQQLKDVGVELFKGSFDNADDVAAAYKGCYGAFVNTDTYSQGRAKEIHSAIQLFEFAHREPAMRHFVYSSLEYAHKLGNFRPEYYTVTYDGKGVFGDFMQAQKSTSTGDGLTWSIVTTGPYMEGLSSTFLGPLPERENGAVVFALPVGDGHLPVVTLRDIAWWVRYTFDHRAETSGQNLKIASEMLQWETLAQTFTKVTGIPSIYKRMGVEEYFETVQRGGDEPMVLADGGKGSPSVKETFAGMYRIWRDDLLTRDMEWIRKIHPDGDTLESWLRESGYDGTIKKVTGLKYDPTQVFAK
ncbi:hypothetical protein V5O48_013237 [Marasmius crinis-equi]|uniref:NmrA-like domain-containing protein n=1 Tax=Marasmius crinis-equi TaxID=585013 RepID=A0ABR3F0N7_9AGAR